MKFILALLLVTALAVAVFQACGLGLCGHHCWERVRVSRSLGAKHQVSNWPCSLGLSSCPSRIRLRLNSVDPSEGPKLRPVGTERQPSDLPYPLLHFWEYLALGGRVWLLCTHWDTICSLGMGLLAHSLWRRVKRRLRQVSAGDATCRKGPAVVSPHGCPEQSYEAGSSGGSRAQQDNSPPHEPSSLPFTVPLLLVLPGHGPAGLSFLLDRPPGKGRSG